MNGAFAGGGRTTTDSASVLTTAVPSGRHTAASRRRSRVSRRLRRCAENCCIEFVFCPFRKLRVPEFIRIFRGLYQLRFHQRSVRHKELVAGGNFGLACIAHGITNRHTAAVAWRLISMFVCTFRRPSTNKPYRPRPGHCGFYPLHMLLGRRLRNARGKARGKARDVARHGGEPTI